MKLIIAEKPSLAKNIATALGIKKREDGYLENDKYVVSWAFGHLYSLKNVDDYIGKKTSWKDVPLPFIPNPFEFKIKTQKNKDTGIEEADKGVKKQVEILKKLASRADITEIVNAGDADREGQIIIDIIIDHIKVKKNVTRLWLPEQTESTIRKQVEKLEENSKYYTLAQEGYARTYMDWLFGINLTRYVSTKVNKLLPIGRVLIPVVKYIYDRDLEIRNFVKTKYFQLESKSEKDGVIIPLILKNKKFKDDELEKALELANTLNQEKAVVKSIDKKEIKKNPGKLFSLSNLQGYLSKKHKIDFTTSLEVIQGLYEDGLITYPRTNTEYLAENEKDKVKEIIATLTDHNLIFKDTKKIFDDSKIESHSALIITVKKPGNLSGNRATVYNTILNRFLSNFLNEDTITEKVTMTIVVGEEEFKLNGEAIKQEGFYKYEPEKFENQLPQLIKDEEFVVDFNPIEKETSPPKKVSEEDLAKYLKNPFKKDGDSEDEEYQAILQGVEIGTEATRTGIVENAKKYQYISQKGSNYSIESLGEKLIEILEQLKINMYKEKSVEFSKLQKKVFKGEAKLEELTDLTTKEISEIISNNIQIPKFVSEYNGPPREDTRVILGKCPKCGSNIYEGGKAFYCDGYKNDPRCNNSVFKNNKLIPNISTEDALNLIAGKEVLFKDIKSSKGNIFSAYFTLVEEGQYCNLKLSRFFDDKKPQ
ncbi:MAG: type IA DNA topoisomerase [Fusobacteriaceae bacterium]